MKPVQICVKAVDKLLKEDPEILEERSPESTRDAIELLQLARDKCHNLESRLSGHVQKRGS
jgi:hypothetical protein